MSWWRDHIIEQWNMKIDTPWKTYLHRQYNSLEEAIEKEVEKHEKRIQAYRASSGKPVSIIKQQDNVKIVRKLLDTGELRCPHCGGGDLVWACCGKRIGEK
jgi:Ribonuclease G/E